MVLIGIKQEYGWLYSRWELTYGTGWDRICKGVRRMYDDLKDAELFVDGEKVSLSTPADILALHESGRMTIRGVSDVLKHPIMITLYNQIRTVDATVHQSGEFASPDYESINKALAPYMSSLEIAMFG